MTYHNREKSQYISHLGECSVTKWGIPNYKALYLWEYLFAKQREHSHSQLIKGSTLSPITGTGAAAFTACKKGFLPKELFVSVSCRSYISVSRKYQTGGEEREELHNIYVHLQFAFLRLHASLISFWNTGCFPTCSTPLELNCTVCALEVLEYFLEYTPQTFSTFEWVSVYWISSVHASLLFTCVALLRLHPSLRVMMP